MKKILSLLFSFRSGKISDRYLLRGTPMEERLNISPAPWILTIVLVWVTSSVLLALSASNAHSAKNITQGSTALRDFTAPADFEYANERENEERKKQVLERVPFFYRVSPQETILIQSDLVQLPECVRIRSAALAAKRHYDVIKGSLVSRLTAGISRALLAELDMAFRQKSTYNNFQNKWQRLLREGLLPVKQREGGKVSTQIRTIDSYGRINAPVRIGDMPDPPRAAQELAEVIFPSHSAVLPEFRQLLIALLRDGNLLLAPEYRSEAREQALKNYRPVPRQIRCGEVLIQSGQVVTPELMELAEAAERSIPPAPPPGGLFQGASESSAHRRDHILSLSHLPRTGQRKPEHHAHRQYRLYLTCCKLHCFEVLQFSHCRASEQSRDAAFASALPAGFALCHHADGAGQLPCRHVRLFSYRLSDGTAAVACTALHTGCAFSHAGCHHRAHGPQSDQLPDLFCPQFCRDRHGHTGAEL